MISYRIDPTSAYGINLLPSIVKNPVSTGLYRVSVRTSQSPVLSLDAHTNTSPCFTSSSSPPISSTLAISVPLLNVFNLTCALLHNQIYWKAKPKVPFVGGYNEGTEKSKQIRQSLVGLGGTRSPIANGALSVLIIMLEDLSICP